MHKHRLQKSLSQADLKHKIPSLLIHKLCLHKIGFAQVQDRFSAQPQLHAGHCTAAVMQQLTVKVVL